MRYDRRHHAAASTTSYVFGQLIPYIGTSGSCWTHWQAVSHTGPIRAARGSSTPWWQRSRVALGKGDGIRVVSNDWEPTRPPSRLLCRVQTCAALRRPAVVRAVIAELNALAPPTLGDPHLCPREDANPDLERERMFYMPRTGSG